MPEGGLWWLVAGGLAYTGGVVFFVFDSRWRYAHFVWHLFVLAGTACHFFAVLWYARVDIPKRSRASPGHACGPAKPAPRHPAEAAPPACYGGS